MTSPLSRTLQTATLVFADCPDSIPWHVEPLVTEFFPRLQECQGRLRRELEPEFPHIDLSALPADLEWWEVAEDVDRIHRFMDAMAAHPARKIAVTCHYGFINLLLQLEDEHIHHSPDVSTFLLPGLGNCNVLATRWWPVERELELRGA